jgi:small subunit ribosomal protein S9
MNILQRAGPPRGLALVRSLQTTATYVPPASLRDVDRAPRRPLRAKPDSPTFYTGRPGYNDALANLEKAAHHAQSALRTLALLPLPAFARAALPPRRPVWKSRREMGGAFDGPLTNSRYRRAITSLTKLDEYRSIAKTAHATELEARIENVLRMFEKDDKAAVLARGRRKPVVLDQFGRSYTVGRRKTSAARVWMIPVKTPSPPPSDAAPARPESLPSIHTFGQSSTPGAAPASPFVPSTPVQTSTILVNNVPLSTYFPLAADRERIVRPLKLTGVLGAYNVFALVRGGGTSGQSGAVMHGIAKGVAAHEKKPEVDLMLRRCTCLFVFFAMRCSPDRTTLQPNSSAATRVWSSGKRPASRRLARRLGSSSFCAYSYAYDLLFIQYAWVKR